MDRLSSLSLVKQLRFKKVYVAPELSKADFGMDRAAPIFWLTWQHLDRADLRSVERWSVGLALVMNDTVCRPLSSLG